MSRLATCAVLIAATATTAMAADAPIVARRDDAFIAHRNGSSEWTIGSTGLEFVLGFDASGTLAPIRLYNPLTEREWTIGKAEDVSLVIAGERAVPASNGPLAFTDSRAQSTANGVRLDLVFEHRAQRLRVTRSYAAYPGSPTIEAWTRVESTGTSPVEVTGLTAWQFVMPNNPIKWLGGLRRDGPSDLESEAFYLNTRNLDLGERFEIGSNRRSSEDYVPFFLVDGGPDRFYGGIMWSAGWSAAFERHESSMRVSAYYPNVITSVTPQQPLDVPHAFFGITAFSINDESGALHNFILNGVRKGRPFRPMVTYNTWFPYGSMINEDRMVAEIARAASLGVELFVLDAGWWVGAGTNDDYDFTTGLGDWREDADRFPSSLASLADYAHGLGMKFGIWVEPVRIALGTLGNSGLARETWLAMNDGSYGAEGTAQICLSMPAAREWVFNEVVKLIDRVHPDYLKWDNNFWINCNRSGHLHGSGDGPFAHMHGLYTLFSDLRNRYPDLMIENVSGGGNFIDFGMLAYTDTAWMDDRTTPALHVRHNIEGLTFAFPPGYLFSFLIDGIGEPLAGNPDLPLVARSRMPGVFGVTYRTGQMHEDTGLAIAAQIADYKKFRDIVADANATLLSAQAPVDENSWEVLQELSPDALRAAIFAFKAGEGEGRIVVKPRNLNPDVIYNVESLDTGYIGSERGQFLMQDGIEIVHEYQSRAHVLILRARD